MVSKNIIKSIRDKRFLPFPFPPFEGTSYDNGGILEFYGMDSYDFYIQNLKTQPEDWYYRNNSVRYTLNSEGYRTKEFKDIDWKNSIVIFGCSHVFGIGVDDSHTISSFLENMIGIPVINMGVAGSSIQLALHNSLMLYQKYGPPKAVIYCWTSLMRHLIYTNNCSSQRIANRDMLDKKSSQHFIPFNLLNIELVRNIWEDKTEMYEFSTFYQTAKLCGCHSLGNSVNDDFGRDLSHFGRKSTKLYAERIYQKIKL
jgi:hypothetical protein